MDGWIGGKEGIKEEDGWMGLRMEREMDRWMDGRKGRTE